MKITFRENKGIPREKEPVSFGIPLPQGQVMKAESVNLETETGHSLPFGSRILARWHDRSIKWLLLDAQVDVPAHGKFCFELTHGEQKKGLDKVFQVPFMDQGWDENAAAKMIPDVILTDQAENDLKPEIKFSKMAHDTLMRKTVRAAGRFSGSDTRGIEWGCKLHFFRDQPFVKCEFTIVNSRAARHVGGAWDLGDANGFLFKDLSLVINRQFNGPAEDVVYSERFDLNPDLGSAGAGVLIYQGASGLSNWQSKNHINRHGKNPVTIDGYEVVCSDKTVSRKQSQASPFVCLKGEKDTLFCCPENFWQNFPKTIGAESQGIQLGLFPGRFGDLFELQPGEQKTHTFYYGYEVTDIAGESFQWMTAPLVPEIDYEAYYAAMLRPRPVRGTGEKYERMYDEYVGHCVDGEHSFKQKNEIIDEYGWRNFGDVFADHESVFKEEGEEFISHYNNQYDVIKGAVIQFMRSGDRWWFELAVNYADHICDIDIYHTDEDKYQYNHGLFWHTDHHLDAHTCTHRTISEAHRASKPEWAFGGGPYLEHNYATGLVYLYWLTGNERYREGALEMCSFIVNWLEGPDTCAELLFQAFRDGLKKARALGKRCGDEIYVFQGPCRASGNSLNTLLDGYLLTGDKKYILYAEQVISMAVHPDDDQDEMNLLNAELRWFYTVFLQALGRYLDIKKSLGAFDAGFAYGRAVLINYARWMAENEYPYLEKPEILEFPNETWAAQDIRKADIFAIASSYAPGELVSLFQERATFFFEHSLAELNTYGTRFLTRPLALIMTNGMPYLEMMNSTEAEGEFEMDGVSGNNFVRPGKEPDFLGKLLINLGEFSFRKEMDWIKVQKEKLIGRS